MKNRFIRRCAVGVIAAFALGCGYSEAEMATQKRALDEAVQQLRATQKNQEEERARAEQLKNQLAQAGSEGDELRRALTEYKQRAERLAAIDKRFQNLKARLQKLTQVGVKFVVRDNRMVIELPGDILFDSGKDVLKTDGTKVLLQVAELIRGDADLNSHQFQVVGHTDNAKYPRGGQFRDNWGLSLARARRVLLSLVDVEAGGLNPKKWSAAGYGEFGPVEGTVETQEPEQMTHNRRVELVLRANVDEIVDLSKMH